MNDPTLNDVLRLLEEAHDKEQFLAAVAGSSESALLAAELRKVNDAVLAVKRLLAEGAARSGMADPRPASPKPKWAAARPPWAGPLLTPGTAAPPGYEVLGEIGRGGMGVVYKARHLALNRLCALKMILSGRHASAEERQRFL